MKQNLFNMIKKHGPKAVVFLLLATLVLTFLSAEPGYAAISDEQVLQTKTGQQDIMQLLAYGKVWAGKAADLRPDTSAFEDISILGDDDKLPQAGGISPATLIGLLGLAMIAAGGTVFTILRKKNHGKNS